MWLLMIAYLACVLVLPFALSDWSDGADDEQEAAFLASASPLWQDVPPPAAR